MAQQNNQQETMVPTREWLRQAYNFFNEKYFNNELSIPLLIVEEDCNFEGQEVWGYFKPNIITNWSGTKVTMVKYPIGTLSLSSKYRRTVKAVEETLLHEMVHVYVYTVLNIAPRNPHGREFMNIANRINADGWNISAVTEKMGNEQLASGYKQGTINSYTALCVSYIYNGRSYFIRVNPADKNFFPRTLASRGAQNVVRAYYGNNIKLSYFPISTVNKLIGLEAKGGFTELAGVMKRYFGGELQQVNRPPRNKKATN